MYDKLRSHISLMISVTVTRKEKHFAAVDEVTTSQHRNTLTHCEGIPHVVLIQIMPQEM